MSEPLFLHDDDDDVVWDRVSFSVVEVSKCMMVPLMFLGRVVRGLSVRMSARCST